MERKLVRLSADGFATVRLGILTLDGDDVSFSDLDWFDEEGRCEDSQSLWSWGDGNWEWETFSIHDLPARYHHLLDSWAFEDLN